MDRIMLFLFLIFASRQFIYLQWQWLPMIIFIILFPYIWNLIKEKISPGTENYHCCDLSHVNPIILFDLIKKIYIKWYIFFVRTFRQIFLLTPIIGFDVFFFLLLSFNFIALDTIEQCWQLFIMINSYAHIFT